MKVQVFTSSLTPGIHTGSVTITATGTGKSTVVPLTVVVPDTPFGSTITLTPAQQFLTFNYRSNTTSNPTQTVFVGTSSTQSANFTATTSDPWIGVSAASYVAPARSAACFAPGLFFVTVDPTGLTVGVYKGTITLSGAGQGPVTVPVTLTISSTAVLNANPSFIALDTSTSLLSSNLAVTALRQLFLHSRRRGTSPWLSITPGGGASGNNPADLTVVADPTGLPAGTYHSSIIVSGPNGTPTLTVPVQFTVTSAVAVNSLNLSPQTLNFAAISGGGVVPQFTTISGTVAQGEAVTLAALSDGGWLSVEPLSGVTPLFVKVTPNTAAAPSSYTGSIVVTSLATGAQATIALTYKLTARSIVVTPASLTFTQQAKGAALAPQELQVTANAASVFHVVSQPAWTKPLSTSDFSTPAKLVVSVDPIGMAPGQYEANIQLSGPNTVVIPVALTIPQPTPPGISASSMSFAYELGAPPPPAQTLTVTSPSGPVYFTVAASTESGISWLSATPGSGPTPGTVSVSINVAQLTPGKHQGSLTIRFDDAAATTSTVSVALTVTGSAVRIQTVLNAATLAPTSISPGQVITLTGSGLGPVAPLVARPNSSGAYDTALGTVHVLFDGVAAPSAARSGPTD